MNYSVQQVKKLFEEKGIIVKQGTIENYRSKLFSLGIIANNQSMSQEHVNTFEKIVKEKNEKNTWEDLMYKLIYSDFSQYIKTDFKWSNKIIIRHLLWAITNNHYKVYSLDLNYDTEDFHIFCCIIDNFVEMAQYYEPYKKSQGTDGNPTTSFKISTQDNKWYYIIGKLNYYTKNEDIHVFYNSSPYFDIMQCRYILGGDCDDDTQYAELWKTCRQLVLS